MQIFWNEEAQARKTFLTAWVQAVGLEVKRRIQEVRFIKASV